MQQAETMVATRAAAAETAIDRGLPLSTPSQMRRLRELHDELRVMFVALHPDAVDLSRFDEGLEVLAYSHQDIGIAMAGPDEALPPHKGTITAGSDRYCLVKELLRTVTYAREIARQLNEPELTLAVGLFNDAALCVKKEAPSHE